jgi:putative tricarboxylic transport membrane protein
MSSPTRSRVIGGARGALAGAVLAALGALALVEALRIRDDWTGARLLPAVIGTVLVILGAVHPLGAAADPPAWPDPASRRRVAFVFGVLVLYAAGLPWLGFLPAMALFLAILLRSPGAYSWAATIALTGAIAVASHLVFERWLGMPLPPGLLGP